jgi:hypothetical protein
MQTALARALSIDDVNQLGRDTGQSERLRTITPHRLFLSTIAGLGGGKVESLADLLREFNHQNDVTVAYKAFYNRLACPSFAKFMQQMFARLVERLSVQTLAPEGHAAVARQDASAFSDGMTFLIANARRSNPKRDRKSGRLRTALVTVGAKSQVITYELRLESAGADLLRGGSSGHAFIAASLRSRQERGGAARPPPICSANSDQHRRARGQLDQPAPQCCEAPCGIGLLGSSVCTQLVEGQDLCRCCGATWTAVSVLVERGDPRSAQVNYAASADSLGAPRGLFRFGGRVGYSKTPTQQPLEQ